LSERGDDARLLAGGQSLVPALNMRLLAPELLIDIGGLHELRGISEDDNIVHIGALTRHADLLRSPIIGRQVPLLAEAVKHVAHPAVRNRGTIGGSIANADPAAELPACMVALGARLVARGPAGTRTVSADDFFLGLYETALAPDEILVAIEIDSVRDGDRSGFAELARRHGDYALVGLAAHGRAIENRFATLRLVLLAVGPTPTRAQRTEAVLVGGPVTAETMAAAQAALAAELDPPDDTQASSSARRHMAGVLLARVIDNMLGRALVAGNA
jgi:carbon-monoxide dehydrogenase medium subunit